MTFTRLMVLALLSATMAAAACGKKGSPIRPGEEPKEEQSLFD